jgi:hypothetical protein
VALDRVNSAVLIFYTVLRKFLFQFSPGFHIAGRCGRGKKPIHQTENSPESGDGVKRSLFNFGQFSPQLDGSRWQAAGFQNTCLQQPRKPLQILCHLLETFP